MKKLLKNTLPAVRKVAESLPKLWGKAELPVVFQAGEDQVHAFFYLLGRVAKASGRVDPQHIKATKSLMENYISDNQHSLAQEAFREGRDGPEDRRFTVEHAFKLYITKGPRWLEPFQVLDGLMRVAMSNGEFTAKQADVVETVRGSVGVSIRPYWFLRDTLAKKYGVDLQLSGKSFDGAQGNEFEKQKQKVRSDTFGRKRRKPDAVFSGSSSEVDDSRSDYEILELEDGASLTAVKNQYRKLVKKYHPDMQPKDEENEEVIKAAIVKFHEIQEAYTRLTSHE